MPVSHVFHCNIPDNSADVAAGKILPSHWNSTHTISVDLATEVTGTLDPSHLTGVVNSVTANDASLTISPTTGAVLANVNLAHTWVWTGGHTFNNVAPTFGTMTLGSVFFAGTGGQLTQDNANFFWDDGNNRLGIGTTGPLETIHAKQGGDRAAVMAEYTGTAATITAGAGFVASFNGSEKLAVGWLAPTNTGSGFASANNSLIHSIADGLFIYTDAAKDVAFGTGNGAGTITDRLRILGAAGSGSVAGNIGVGVANPTASLHVKAGSTTAGTAPIKLTSGSLNTTAEAGAVEFLTDKFYGTITTGAARKELQLSEGLTSGRVPFATTNGRLTDSAILTFNSATPRLTVSGATATHLICETTGTGTGDFTQLALATNGALNGVFASTVAAFTTAGAYVANQTIVQASNAGGLMLLASNASGGAKIVTGGTAATNERIQVDANGNVCIGNAAIATNATNGFLYIPTCAGAPSGTPTTKTGRVAMVFDTTNNKLMIYDGGWIGVALA